MIKEADIVNAAESYAREILWRDLPENLTYHSISHTVDVVASAMEIGRKQNASDEELEILQLAGMVS